MTLNPRVKVHKYHNSSTEIMSWLLWIIVSQSLWILFSTNRISNKLTYQSFEYLNIQNIVSVKL